MRMKDIKDVGDLREMTINDLGDVIDEIRSVARQRGGEMLRLGMREGQARARRAIGARSGGDVTMAFWGGLILGALVAAVATLLFSPMSPREVRKKLDSQMSRMRARTGMSGNGRSAYEETMTEAERVMEGGRR